MTPLKEVGLVIEHEFKAVFLSLRSILFFVIYGGSSFIVGSVHGKLIGFFDKNVAEKLGNLSPEAIQASGINATNMFQQLFEQNPGLVETFGGQKVADALVDGSLPVVVLSIMIMSIFLLPQLIMIIGFDRISQDLHSKFSRYVFLRLNRGPYLAGKILAQWMAALIIVIGVHALLLGMAASQELFDLSELMRAAPTFWLGMMVFLLAYIALTAVFSVSLTPPFAALAVGLIALMGFGILSLNDLFGAVWMGDQGIALWVGTPMAYGLYLGHIFLFGGLSFLRLRTREV